MTYTCPLTDLCLAVQSRNVEKGACMWRGCVRLHVCGGRVACLVYRLCQPTSNSSCHVSRSIALTSSVSRETHTHFSGGRE